MTMRPPAEREMLKPSELTPEERLDEIERCQVLLQAHQAQLKAGNWSDHREKKATDWRERLIELGVGVPGCSWCGYCKTVVIGSEEQHWLATHKRWS